MVTPGKSIQRGGGEGGGGLKINGKVYTPCILGVTEVEIVSKITNALRTNISTERKRKNKYLVPVRDCQRLHHNIFTTGFGWSPVT